MRILLTILLCLACGCASIQFRPRLPYPELLKTATRLPLGPEQCANRAYFYERAMNMRGVRCRNLTRNDHVYVRLYLDDGVLEVDPTRGTFRWIIDAEER